MRKFKKRRAAHPYKIVGLYEKDGVIANGTFVRTGVRSIKEVQNIIDQSGLKFSLIEVFNSEFKLIHCVEA